MTTSANSINLCFKEAENRISTGRPTRTRTKYAALTQAVRGVYQQHWTAIRSHHHIGHRVQDTYNYCIEDLNMHTLEIQFQQLFRNQVSRFKVNASFGFIMRHVETEELRYYHSSQNHGRILDVPRLISQQEDFDNFLEDIMQEDVLEWARQQRQDTKWIVVFVTNITLFINKMPDYPIGCKTVSLPGYIKNNKAIISLTKDGEYKETYQDNLCFFRALALDRGAPQMPKGPFETIVRDLFADIVGGNPLHFEGVQLMDLPDLELKLELNINVFELVKNEEDKIVGRIVQRSHRRYPDTLNLNLHQNHFSLITNLDQYCHAYE